MKFAMRRSPTLTAASSLILLSAARSGGDSPSAPQPATAPTSAGHMEKKDDAMMANLGDQRFAAHFCSAHTSMRARVLVKG